MIEADYLPLVEITRGSIVESIHIGAIAVVDTNGKLVACYGNPEKVTHMRSSAKPLQVLPFIEMGGLEHFDLTDRELAIMCASHSGTDEHKAVIEGMQQKIGITESDLLCGAHIPLHQQTADAMLLRGEKTTSNRSNCSGKHTGMLAHALLRNAPKKDYVNPQHPIQKIILQTIAEMCDLNQEQILIGVDGCSAPVFAVPLRSAAFAYARLSDPRKLPEKRAKACRRIVKAMINYPDMVAGPERFDTSLMKVTNGMVVAKAGAEGYQGMGLMVDAIHKDSPALGITFKIADGDLTGRAKSLVALEILRQLGALSQSQAKELANYDNRSLVNFRNIHVGELRACFKLKIMT